MQVTVVIPTYNRAHLVCESIDSALRQTYSDVYIVVVDDGSTDETERILRRFRDKIIYIKQENKGPGSARNRGMLEAKGKYIAFLDSDDLWFDFKLELQVAVMEKMPEIGFLSTEFCIMKESGEKIHSGLRSWHKERRPWDEIYDKKIDYSSLNIGTGQIKKDFKIYYGNLYEKLLRDPYVLPSSAILRRECLNGGIKFPDGVYLYEDWEFFALLSRKYNAAFMDYETTINRGHNDEVRLTHSSSRKAVQNRLRLIESVWKSDPAFMEKHGREVGDIEGKQKLRLARDLILENRAKEARPILQGLGKLIGQEDKYEAIILNIIVYIPGGSSLLNLLRSMRRIFILRKRKYQKSRG